MEMKAMREVLRRSREPCVSMKTFSWCMSERQLQGPCREVQRARCCTSALMNNILGHNVTWVATQSRNINLISNTAWVQPHVNNYCLASCATQDVSNDLSNAAWATRSVNDQRLCKTWTTNVVNHNSLLSASTWAIQPRRQNLLGNGPTFRGFSTERSPLFRGFITERFSPFRGFSNERSPTFRGFSTEHPASRPQFLEYRARLDSTSPRHLRPAQQSWMGWRCCSSTADATSSSSTHSTSSSASGQSIDSVVLTFEQGLPHLTVPLPSRRELCRFPLRPVTHTVDTLVQQLQAEDRGIDRVLVRTVDGVRISSSASIESLLLADFELIINDVSYHVVIPDQARRTSEELTDLSDVRQLVNKLYAALHVDEHQVARERDIMQEIEEIRTQLIPLEKQRSKLVAAAERRATVLMYAGLGYMALQFGFLARLTWWEYSWDIMEPVTYFVTYGTAMACYAYYVLTKHDFLLPEVRDRQFLLGFHRKARKTGMDVDNYNSLKNRLHALESDLRRLRDPLALNLPPQRLAKIIAEDAAQSPLKSSTFSVLQDQLKSLLKIKH